MTGGRKIERTETRWGKNREREGAERLWKDYNLDLCPNVDTSSDLFSSEFWFLLRSIQ